MQAKAGALGIAVHADLATMQVHDRAHDGQAEAPAVAALLA